MSNSYYFLQVSVDSTTDTKVNRNIDTFEGMKILEKNDIQFTTALVLNKANSLTFHQTISDMLDLRNLRSINLQVLQETKNPKYNFAIDSITVAQVDEMAESIVDMQKAKKRTDVMVIGINTESTKPKSTEKDIEIAQKGLQDRSIAIACIYANGNVSMAGALRRDSIIGNVFKQDWTDIWKTAQVLYRNEQSKKQMKLKLIT